MIRRMILEHVLADKPAKDQTTPQVADIAYIG